MAFPAAGLALVLGLLWAPLGPRRWTRACAWLARLGAAGSLVYLAVAFATQTVCAYCFAAHACNFAFLACSELARRAAKTPDPLLTELDARQLDVFTWAGAVVMVAAFSAAGVVAHRVEVARAERELEQSLASGRNSASSVNGFSGRYRLGPANAAARLVVFSDYQCPECRAIHAQIRRVMASRPDMSYSPKHFPFCAECNRHVTRTLHPHACRAAAIVEGAGILGGESAFFAAHDWMFERAGDVGDADVRAWAAEHGLDGDQLLQVAAGSEASVRIGADVDEAMALGLAATPMLFVNGVELRGWQAPDAIGRAVEFAAHAAKSHGTSVAAAPASDRPPTAREKAVLDWLASKPAGVPRDAVAHQIGPDERPVRVVVFGDYEEPNTAAVDALLRERAGRGAISYEFRHFPANPACNPVAERVIHAGACDKARLAEAAGLVNKANGFWLAHAWLMAHQSAGLEEAVHAVAQEIGATPDALERAFNAPGAAMAVRLDAAAGSELGLASIPAIFVNDRPVARWRIDVTREVVIGDILDAARNGQ